jgi:hypothetical protein
VKIHDTEQQALFSCSMSSLTPTRVCDAWEEPFDFLGYAFGVQRRFPTGTRFLAPVPSKKAQ